MVKTLMPTLLDEKQLKEIFIVSCAKGHRGVFEWLCEQKLAQDEKFMQSIIPVCAFAALVGDHARLYNEIRDMKPIETLGADTMLLWMNSTCPSFACVNWAQKDVKAIFSNMTQEDCVKVLEFFIKSKNVDNLATCIEYMPYLEESAAQSLLSSMENFEGCSRVVSIILTRAKGVRLSNEIFSEEQLEFLALDAVRSDAMQTFLWIVPRVKEESAKLIQNEILTTSYGHYDMCLRVYFPELFA